MLDRFNFFDVYAYLLPGAVAIALAWLPYVLLGADLPSGAVSGALALLGAAYMAGHALQTLASDLWASNVVWLGGKRELPSHALLDVSDKTLSPKVKSGLIEHLRDVLKIDVSAGTPEEVRNARNDAFRMCRTLVKRDRGASYAEQYQGLYNLMRGSATALLLAGFYYTGWMIAKRDIWGYVPSEDGWKTFMIAIAVLLGLRQLARGLSLFRPRGSRAEKVVQHPRVVAVFKGLLYLLSLGAGVLLAAQRSGAGFGIHFIVLPIFAFALMVQFATSYHTFAKSFAEAIYRDYWAMEGSRPRKRPEEPLPMD